MIRSAPLIFTSLLLSSCATIFNTTYKRIDVITNQPATFICVNNGDTLYGCEFTTLVKRGKSPLQFIVIGDSSRTTIMEDSRLSFAYFANISGLFILGTAGMIIDSYTPRRFSYPGFYKVDIGDNPGDGTKKRSVPSVWTKYRNAFKFSPLKLVAVANPGAEVGYERFLGKCFGVQLRLAALSPPLSAGAYYDLKGVGVGIEPRLYFGQRLRSRWFTGIRASWSQVKFSARYYFAPTDTADHTTLPFEAPTRVKRTIAHVAPGIGFQFTTGRFVGELGIGVGVKYRHVAHPDKPPGTAFYFESRHPSAYPVIHREGNTAEVGVPGSFMIGWMF